MSIVDQAFALFPKRANSHEFVPHLNMWHRVPKKLADSIMLKVFQSRTGQQFPRSPLPVFEVIQELRQVRHHYEFAALLRIA
jgi:hypothetical protein